MMNFPTELKYSRDHEWVKMLDDATALVGISDFAQSELGSVVFVTLPETGDRVTAGVSACEVESVKTVSDVVSPVTGEIAAVNTALDDAPELLNESPYDAWIFRVEHVSAVSELLDAAAYEAFTKEEH
jgi:glycine cleavage system H protein